MLVLSRKSGESLIIDGDIEVTILEVSNDVVKVGIKAPKEVGILRKELYAEVERNNLSAEHSAISNDDLLKQFGEIKNLKKL
ncbi:carbon storage regulator [Paenibacillus oryzae]|jgi:carbon storage regulator|uniref:Translational regulator CsrA n=1 Tax=Paenibacillus oryzae TaxID=1844972 RepID=A0A1A5YD61_9BACL|nr:carbon storage regulator CsrA [Paenibacillus oryzae]OBR63556.1 carbon storage regulator [Paenibacillus oryzae]